MPSCSSNVLKLPKRGKEMRSNLIEKLADWDTENASLKELKEAWWEDAYTYYSDMSDEELMKQIAELEI